MGMYTELIFGAELKRETPQEIIDNLKFMIDEDEGVKPEGLPSRFSWMFQGASEYFGVNKAVSKIWFDDTFKSWHVSTRSNIKNYKGEIEIFLEWIKPWIRSGSGERDMYAIVMYEEWDEPQIYYLNEGYSFP